MAENFEGTDDFIGFEAGSSAPPRPSAPSAPSSGGNRGSLRDFVRSEAQTIGIDPDIADRMFGLESGYRSDALSPKGAFGPAQLMPATADYLSRKYGGDPRNPFDNARLGLRYLKEHLDEFGDYRKAVAAYQTGPGNVRKYGGPSPYSDGNMTNSQYADHILGGRKEIPAGPGRRPAGGDGAIPQEGTDDDLDFTSLQGREIGHYGQMAPPQAKGAGKATERTAMQAFVTDPAASLTAGAGGTIKGFGTLWGLAGGDFDNVATRAGEAVREIGEGMKSPGLKARENIRREMIDAQDGEIRKFLTAINATITDPGLFASTLTEQIPNLLPGMAIGRAARVAGAAAGMTGAGAGTLGVGAAVGTGAAMQGADAAGDAFEQIMKADKAEWERNPDFRRLVDEQKMDPDIARRTLALSAVRQAFLTSGGASIALSQLPGARSIERMLVGAKGGVGGAARGAAVGFFGEGTTEGADEAIGKIAGNQAVRETVDPARPLMEGTGEAAAMGALFAPVGGVAGAVSGRRGDPAQVSDVIPNAPGGTPEGSISIDDILGPQPEAPSSPAAPRPEQVAGTMGQLMPMPAPQPQAPPAPTEEDFAGRLREIAERQAGLEEQIGAARGADAAEGDRLRATDARKEWRALEDERRQIVDQLGGEEAAQETLRRAGRGFDAAPDAMATADGFDAGGGREPGMGPRRAPEMDPVGGATIDAATGRPIEALPRPAGMPATQEPIRVEPIDQAGGQPPVGELGGNIPPRSSRSAQVTEELRRLGVSSPAARGGEVSQMPPYPGEDRPVTRRDRVLEELDNVPARPLADPRLGNPAVRAELELMATEAGWAERGGQLLRDNDADGAGGTGRVLGRTKWVPKAAWYGAMKDRLDEKGTQEAVRKALAGEKLSAKQARVIGQMLDHAEAYARMWDAAQAEYESLSPAEQAFVDQAMENTIEAIGRDQVEAIAERVAIETQGESVYTHATRLVSALQGAAYEEEQRRRAEDEPATPEGVAGARPQDARAPPDAARDEPVREGAGAQEGFDLVGQTPDDLRRLDQEQRLTAEQERQARERENAPPAEDFALTGSDRPADVGAAAGQQGLFEQPSLGLNAQPAADPLRERIADKAAGEERGDDQVGASDAPREADDPPSLTKRLRDIAERLGIDVVGGGRGGWHTAGGAIYIPDGDIEAAQQGAVSAAHVFAHELAHAILHKRGLSFRGFPVGEARKAVSNFDELRVVSRAFRPDVWGSSNVRIRRHAAKPEEVIADSIASVLIGKSDIDVLGPLMSRWGVERADIFGREPSSTSASVDKAAPEAATPASEPEQQVAPAPKPTRKQKVAQEAAAATKPKKPRAQKVKEEAEAIAKPADAAEPEARTGTDDARGAPRVDRPAQSRRADRPQTIDVDGKQRPTTNSNGRPIAPDEASIRSFWRWFGDSQVVDAEGRPLVVYHGTTADVSAFQPGVDGGIHFGTSEQANMRASGAGKNLVPAYLRIENARRSKDPGGKWSGRIASAKAAGHDGIAYLNRYEGISTQTALRAQEQGINLDQLSDAEFRKFAPEARASYIAFAPEQIKSATGNAGTFDGTSPDIRQRRGAAPGRISVQDARNYIATLRQSWRNAPRVNVVETADQLPFPHDPDAMGAFFKGQVWIVAGAHESLAEVQYTLFHETIGHYGLRGMFAPGLGDAMARGATEMEGDGITEDTAAEILRGLEKMDMAMAEIAAKNANIRAEAARWRQRNPKGDMSAHAWEMLSIEEAMSNLAGEGRPFTGMKRFLAAAQRLLRAIGLDAVADWMERASDAEALAILADSHAFVQRGQRAHVYGPELAAKFMTAFHGSPHRGIEKFDTDKIGSGEGQQAFGYGLYFASKREVAEHYRKVLAGDEGSIADPNAALQAVDSVMRERTGWEFGAINEDATYTLIRPDGGREVVSEEAPKRVKKIADELLAPFINRGQVYEVDIVPTDDELLDWDKPLSEQSEAVRKAIKSGKDIKNRTGQTIAGPNAHDYLDPTGEEILTALGRGQSASEYLAGLGIRGVRYLDGTSRAAKDGSHNYVIFSGEDVTDVRPLYSRRADRTQTAEDLLSKRVGRGPLEAVTKGVTQALKIDKATKWAFDRLTTLIGDRIPESVKAGVVDKYGLTDAHKNKRAGMFASIRSGYRTGQRFVESLSGITLAESRIMYEWMTEPESRTAELEAQLKPEALERLRGMREFIDSIGAEAVRLGDMSAEVFERNKGAWLHRSYMKHEAEETAAEKAHRARTVKILGDQYKMRGIKHETALDTILSVLPKEWGARVKRQGVEIAFKGKKFIRFERYQHRGEGTATLDGMPDPAGRGKLLEVAYWPEGETVPAKFGDWYREEVWEARWTKGDKVVMHRDFTKPEQDKMGRIAEVRFAVARSLQKMIHDVEVSKFFEWVANTEAKPEGALPAGAKVVEAREQLWRSFGKDEWVKVPETKVPGTDVRRFGKLAGLYVPGPVWNDVRQVRNPKFGPEWFNSMMRAWKLSKALALDTPIPTPSGWTTMGALKPGDQVFDERGEPCEVLGATETQYDHECYEVGFSDGTKIVADAGHLWLTYFRGKAGIRETRDILATLKERTRGDNNHSIPVAGALDLPEVDLPIAPYALGVWLGDGHSRSARVSAGGQDVEAIICHLRVDGIRCGSPSKDKRNDVFTFSMRRGEEGCARGHDLVFMTPKGCRQCDNERRRARTAGQTVAPGSNVALQAKMRSIGLLGNKHIPAAYLRGSIEQRMALLQGLMDTDGSISGRGSCSFTTTIPLLRDGVLELLRSLGYKPSVRALSPSCNGKAGKQAWFIYFQAYADRPVFRLARKAERLRPAPENRQRSSTRQIVSVTPVPSVPVRCILVSSPSHLFLAGEGMVPTHNTALSPAVHMNNVMANFVIADWRDLTAKDIHDALRVMMEPDSPAHKETIERFEDNGGTQGMYVLSEIQREQLKPLLDELRGTITGENNVGELARLAQIAALIGQGQLRDAWEKAGHSAPAKAAKFAGRSLMDAYEKEDTVFRLAAFIRAKREGKTDAEAGAIARESFLDYDINAPWVQMARGTLFPFIAFTYRAAPMLAKVAAEKPWKLLKLGLVAGAINAFGYLASGGDEDDERAMLPKEKEGRVWGFLVPKLLRMGWNDGENPVFLDIRRFIPVGDIIDTGQGHAALPVPPPMIPGGPLALLFELVLNKVGFTGKPITQETDTAGEKAEKVAGFVWKAFMPNLIGIPGVPATEKAWKAGTGQTGAFGQELSTASALASAVGVKIEGYPADVAMQRMKIEMNANRREIEGNVRKMVRQEQAGAMSDEDLRAKVAREYEKLNELNAEIARKLRATQDAQARREAR